VVLVADLVPVVDSDLVAGLVQVVELLVQFPVAILATVLLVVFVLFQQATELPVALARLALVFLLVASGLFRLEMELPVVVSGRSALVLLAVACLEASCLVVEM